MIGQSLEKNTSKSATHFDMWVTFQYALLFISLFISATALGGILNYGIDKLFPDATYSAFLNLKIFLNTYISALIVSFPVFASLFISLSKQAKNNTIINQFRAPKQLIYITMAIAFIAIVWHLIATMATLLGGQFAIGYLAHFGVTLLIYGAIFFSLLFHVKEDRRLS